MDTATLMLSASTFASGAMTGLIWFVQVVHYPLMSRVAPSDPAGWVRYHQGHTTRTGWVVAPLMLVEAGTAGLMVVTPPLGWPGWAVVAQAVLVGVVWALTFGVAVPLHQRLSRGFDAAVHGRLVATNLPRALAWTGRFVLLLYFL